MDKGKKNKRSVLVMVYSLCALAAFTAELYFMINYKKEYVIIAAVGLVFLISVGFLLDEIFDNIIKKPADNNVNDELLKIQKAQYVQGKNLLEEIEALSQLMEDNTRALIENEKNIAKVIIKKNDESNDRIRAAVEEIDFAKMPVPEIKIPDIQIPEIKMPEIKIPDIQIPEVKIPEIAIPSSDNSSEIEAAKNEIINLIEKLSEQVKGSAKLEDIEQIREMLTKGVEAVKVEEVAELVEETSVVEEVPIVEEIPVVEETPIVEENPVLAEDFDINAENTFEDLFKDLADEIAIEVADTVVEETPVIEEMTVEEMPLIMEEMPVVEEKPVVEEILVVEEEPAVEEEPVVEEIPVVEESVPAVSLPDMGDDPNKQLSADEIAALFASIQ